MAHRHDFSEDAPRVAVIAAGRLGFTPDAFAEILSAYDRIYCADGGLNHLRSAGIYPQVLIGDMDSVSPETRRWLDDGRVRCHRFPTRKAKTDLELTLDALSDDGITQADVFCGIGTRWDHSMINILMLERYSRKGMMLRLIDANNRVSYLRGGAHTVSGVPPSWYCSFIAYPEPIRLSLNGFDYDLDGERIALGSTLTISNHLIGEGRIHVVGAGVLMLFSID